MNGNSRKKSSATTKPTRAQLEAVERARQMALAGDPLARAMFGDESWLNLADIAEAEYQADPAAREWAAQYRKRQRKGRKK